ncbi:MAG: hypothetical protein HY951_02960 [Bacteroidia bacterium]|nr:hypothetical protein [Bacteroidia bacterium]
MFVKRAFIICFLFATVFNATAQKNLDFGLFLGTSYYLGDLNNSKQFHNIHFAYGGLIRYNLGSRWAVRGSLISGGLSGDDLDFNYKYQLNRKYTFYTPIVEITGQLELNFLPYKIGDKKHNYTPYVHIGGTFLIASYAIQPYQPAIPFGLGLKFNLLPERVGMGFEWTFRKTFTDGLDKVVWHKQMPTTTTENSYLMSKQTGYYHQRDWYSFFGLFITYQIRQSGADCNTYR